MQMMFFSLTTQSNVSTVDWNEIIYIVVGATIGLFASLAIIVVERILDKKGKLNIFYRRTYQRGSDGRGWGFDIGNDCSFVLPIEYELQNTSNTTRVVRDVALLLYSENKLVGKMHQVGELRIETKKGTEVTKEKLYNFGSEKGSYSFVLPPRSIQRQLCEYLFVIKSSEKDQMQFDTVVARYYDETNKPRFFKIMEVTNCWENKCYNIDEDWLLFEEKIKIKK